MTLKLDCLSALVVEDTQPMQHLITAVLERFGVGKVLHASNGQEAFNVFCRHNPDIIITDWHMAPGNGLELVTNVRRSYASPNRMTPVIMLTGYSAAARVTASRDSGITEYLTKPFHAEDLIRRILHVIRAPRDFILTSAYFGPDRRRKRNTPLKGPLRRSSDNTEMNTN